MKIPPLVILLAVSAASFAAEAEAPSGQLPPIDPANLVSSVTYDLGDRLMTVEQVTEEALPTPPKTRRPDPAPTPQAPPTSAPHELLSIGVVVYTSGSAPARSLVTYVPKGGEAVEFWSSADWRLLAGIGTLTAESGREWGVLVMPQVVHIDEAKARHSQDGENVLPPTIPDFAGAAASYVITKGQATEEQLEPIDELHSFYERGHADLAAAFNAREAARLQREAEARGNPPVPKNITVRARLLTPEEIEATKPDTAAQSR